uniref:Retrotransposon gag domain-containing protein n=1 Tax=Ananas comosus var. bracteatus TaxID=296719 RepID=A0A6V7NI32_ANACO|nr:unnamed protein product [Ananas comosus var. bracteatus]
MKRAFIMSADKQITTPSDLVAKVVVLSDDMKTILNWIKTQSAASSAMPVEKSSQLIGTPPPKAHVTPIKSVAEDISSARDDNDSDDDESIALSLAKGRSQPFKVEAKIEIPNYDGIINTEKLDAWLDQLETYFDLYNYSNAEKKFYSLRYEKERWKLWHVLCQRCDQTMQDYTTDFWRQAWRLASPSTIHRFFVNTLQAYRSAAMTSFVSSVFVISPRRAKQPWTCQESMLEAPSRAENKEEGRSWKMHNDNGNGNDNGNDNGKFDK